MHYPAPGGISGNWAWGQRAFWLYPGQTVSFSVGSGTSLPSSIRQWKWAVYWNETNLNAVSDIDIEVWDTCTNTRVAYQWDYDLRNRIQLRDAEIWGRCLEMRVKAYYVDSPRLVWSADFYHGSVD